MCIGDFTTANSACGCELLGKAHCPTEMGRQGHWAWKAIRER